MARQYSGQLSKQDNGQVAVSVSLASAEASLSVPWRLYLPQAWAGDAARRKTAKATSTVVNRFRAIQPTAPVGLLGR